MNNAPIGIFDSGVGGLTVVREIMSTLPGESIYYFGDTKRCPYGPRDQFEVRKFVSQIGTWLEDHGAKLIVIACNTATAAGLAYAQQAFDVPVIGVIEPGARAAVHATANRRVGVIGTAGTINSGAYTSAIHALDAGITVFSAATPRFVDIVEEGLRIEDTAYEKFIAQLSKVFIRPTFEEIARNYLVSLKQCDIDTLVLGCTHFPLLKPLIGSVIGSSVKLISSAEETALEVQEILSRRGFFAAEASGVHHRFATTSDDINEFITLGSRILGFELENVEHVSIESLEGGLRA